MQDPLTGRVLFPGDPGWDSARHGFAARFDYDANAPQAVVFAQCREDVANAVRWARANNVPIRARSGRHSYQAWSSLNLKGLIVDLSEMDNVSVDSHRKVADISPGIDMLALTEKLCDSGFTLPMATGPTVGLGGLTQGGGFGITTRRFGLMCDNLVGVEIVDANGDILEASDEENSDLFWAIRGGGGGNFGIVTLFRFKVHPVTMAGIFNITYNWSDLIAVAHKWQRWNHAADPALTSLLTLHVDGTVRIEGQCTPDVVDMPGMSAMIAPMLVDPTPISIQAMVVPVLTAARMTFGVDPTAPEWAIRPHSDQQLFKSCSAIALDFIPDEGLAILKQRLETYPPLSAPPSQPSMVQLLGGGGKAAEPSEDWTAVFWRKAKVVVQYDGYWTAPQDAQPTIDWTVETRRQMLPYAHGAYINYHDDQLGSDYLDQYYGGNLTKLREVKKKYDPTNFFTYPQSIPPPD